MWIRLGLVVVAIALLGMLLLGIGAGAGLVRVGPHGLSFGRETETPDAPTQSQVVSADDLLRQAGVKEAEPTSTPVAASAAKPEASNPGPARLASATDKPTAADSVKAAEVAPSSAKSPTDARPDKSSRNTDAVASRDIASNTRERDKPRDREAGRERDVVAQDRDPARKREPARDRNTPAPRGGEMAAIRVCAGTNTALTDSAGNVWEADSGFENGNIENRGEIAIANTRFPALYRHERWNMSSWRRAVPNGDYTVRLHFAETYDLIKAPGQRVFGVELQGRALGDLDVFKEADGRNKALVKSAHITVTDGVINIRFIPTDRNVPEINGIEILPDSPMADADRTPRRMTRVEVQAIHIQAGSTVKREMKGVVWQPDTGFDGGKLVDRGHIKVESPRGSDIYRTEHYDMTGWHKDMPNGKYVVYLYFAETSDSVSKAGQRVFHVSVQGNELRDLDVFKEANGKFKGLIKMFNVTVTDGKLSIIFQKTDKNVPEINAIEVFPER